MSKHTKYLGSACVLATALVAAQASADTLAGFAGVADLNYSHSATNKGGLDNNEATGGVLMALPLADLENLNWEAGASYGHNWTEDYTHANGRSYSDSAEDWNFDFDVFWAGPQSRFGFNGHYDTITHLGHISNGGAFAEYYFNDSLTLAAKGGYQWAGGQPISGHGAYLGIAPTLYAMPNLALTAGFDWQDDVTGGPCQVGLQVNRFCRGDIGGTSFFVNGEFLLNEDIPVAAWAGYTHTDNKFLHEHSNTNTFMVGLRWYFTGGGTLEDHHRNGALHWYLPGT